MLLLSPHARGARVALPDRHVAPATNIPATPPTALVSFTPTPGHCWPLPSRRLPAVPDAPPLLHPGRPGGSPASLVSDLSLPAAQLESAADQRPGETVLVVVYPWPDTLGGTAVTLTHGLNVTLRKDQEGVTYLQTDGPMDPGVSGGVVVNLRGHLVGIPSVSS